MNECAFCNLGVRIIKSNEHAHLFLSNPRRIQGQALVIPKRHVTKPWQLSASELSDIFDLIFFYEKKVLGSLGDGFEIRENFRPDLKENGIKMDHIHFHVIPRRKSDTLGGDNVDKVYFESFKQLPEEEKKKITKLLLE